MLILVELFRLLLAAFVIYGVVLFIIRAYIKIKRVRAFLSSLRQPVNNISNKMVKCEHCGLYCPEKEAVEKKGKIFCSKEHAEEAKDK